MEDGDQLLRRCQQGDETALAELIARYQERLFRLAYRVAGDAALAEEAAVDSLYKIWSRSRQWRGETRAETWMYRVAVRTTLDLRRGWRRWWQRARGAGLLDGDDVSDADPAPGPAEQAIAREAAEIRSAELEQALVRLSPADRLLIHLYYEEERPLAEIAAMVESNADAVKMRLSRARKRLREGMKEG